MMMLYVRSDDDNAAASSHYIRKRFDCSAGQQQPELLEGLVLFTPPTLLVIVRSKTVQSKNSPRFQPRFVDFTT